MKQSSIRTIHLNQGEIIKLKHHNLLEFFTYKKSKRKRKREKKKNNQSGSLNLSDKSNKSG